MDWEEFDRKVQMAARCIDALQQSACKSPSQRAAFLKAVGELQGALEALPIAGEELHEAELEIRARERTAELARANATLQAEISERRRMEEALRDSEEHYRLLFECNPRPMWVFDQQTLSFLDVNEAAIRHYGYTREEFLSLTIKDIRPPEDVPKLLAFQPKVGPQEIGRWRHQKKDGTMIEVELATHDLLFQGRKAWLVLVNDVTERRRAEVEYQAILRTAMDGFLLVDAEGHFLDANDAYCRLTGYSREELLAMSIADVEATETPAEIAQHIQRVKESGWGRFEVHHRYQGGRIVDLEVSTNYLAAGGGRFFVFLRDITERQRTETALKQSEANYRAIFDVANDAIFVHDLETGAILDSNRRMCEMYGWDRAQICCLNVEELSAGIPPYTQEAALQRIKRATEGEPQLFEWLAKDKRGRLFWVEVNLKRAVIGGQDRLLAIVRDISERKRAEERLREQAALLNYAQEAIIVRDLADRILFWNKSAERIYGWTAEEVIGTNIQARLYRELPPQLEEARKALLDKGEWIGELSQFTKDGQEMVVEAHWALVRDESGQPKSVLAINTDITERKKLEAQLRRAQRLESIGTLAGGIAHDLNNILSPVLMGIHLLQQKEPDEESQHWLETMRTNALRGSDLVKQVLTFARGAEGQRVKLSPKYVMKDLVLMLQDTLPKSIEVNYLVPNDLWPVMGDTTQLYQVLMNLCVNARDAMPGGGRLTIKAENTRLDETYAWMRFGAEPGRFVLLTITDTGMGIPPEIMDKIFDPFFTTKEIGQGTGLGLSTVLGIVKSHGGLIDVSSKLGQGTTFKVYLPAVETEPLGEAEEKQSELPGGHGELILVIDDEKTILEITGGALEAHGYAVLTAGDGVEAVALCAEHQGRVQAVLIDMMMPLMDGPATIRALRRLDPQLKIVAASGAPGEEKKTEAANAGAQAFLSKPYTAEQLLQTLAEALAAKWQSQSGSYS